MLGRYADSSIISNDDPVKNANAIETFTYGLLSKSLSFGQLLSSPLNGSYPRGCPVGSLSLINKYIHF